MADDKKKPEAAAETAERPFKDHRRNLMTVAVVGSLMLAEGVGIFMAIQFVSGGPQAGVAADEPAVLVDDDGNVLPNDSEVRVTDVVAFNSKTGRVFVYQMQIYAEVETRQALRLEKLLVHRQNTVEDRFSRIVRACDPKYLNEPGLETLKRQFKLALEGIAGEDMPIKRILIPQFSKSRAD